jgi:hypothetical protein
MNPMGAALPSCLALAWEGQQSQRPIFPKVVSRTVSSCAPLRIHVSIPSNGKEKKLGRSRTRTQGRESHCEELDTRATIEDGPKCSQGAVGEEALGEKW